MMVLKIRNVAILLLLSVMFGCKTKVAPTSERIKRIWVAKSVSENSSEVYKAGAATNLQPGYSAYRLDLSTPPTVVLKDRDGGTYKGTYTIPSENKLSISGLNPEPTATGGKLDFTITFISDNEISLLGSTTYAKTGGTTNTYTLTASN